MRRDTGTRTAQITVRQARPGDMAALVRLAALDSATVPSGAALVAEAEGELIAALPLGGGRSIADPFQHTSAMVEMLELRAAQLAGSRGRRTAPGLGERLRAATRAFGASPRLP
jgi:hypothetical protein